jgi:cell division protein FtsB
MEPSEIFKKAAFGDPRTDAQVKAAKRINTVALIFLVILLGSTFFYFLRLNHTKVALQASKSEIEVQKDSLAQLQSRQARLIEELNSYKNNLSQLKHQSDSTLQALVATVKARDYGSAQTIAKEYDASSPPPSPTAPESRYVNLYLYRAPANAAKDIGGYLAEKGFQVLREAEFDKMERWLTPSSTVEYFRENDKPLAEELARALSRLTAHDFELQYTPSRNALDRPNWLNITLIGEEGVQEIMQMNLPIQRRK